MQTLTDTGNNIRLWRLWKTTKAIWPGFSLCEKPQCWARQSRSLAFGICEGSVHKLAKAQGCFEGSRQYFFVMWENYPSTNSKWDCLAEEIVTHKHDKIDLCLLLFNRKDNSILLTLLSPFFWLDKAAIAFMLHMYVQTCTYVCTYIS